MATNTAIASSSNISEGPHQPGPEFKFPKRTFGKKTVVQRSFQHTWFSRWPFLDYREDDNTVFCYICRRMFLEKKNKICTKADPAFVSSMTIFACLAL